MSVEFHNLPAELSEPAQDAGSSNSHPIKDAITLLKAILKECAEDDAKRKLYFGYFETSDGDL